MAIEIKMPSLSPTMKAGKIVKWNFSMGDTINSGDVLVLIETDKAIMEFEVPYEGKLARIVYNDGSDNVSVGTTIGWILEDEHDSLPDTSENTDTISNSTTDTSENTDTIDHPINIYDAKIISEGTDKLKKEHQLHDNKAVYGKNKYSSPLARQYANKLGIDIELIKPNRRRRIMKDDVLKYHESKNTMSEPSDILYSSQYSLTNIQSIIARRMCQSKTDAPHFYVKSTCYIDELLNIKNKFKQEGIITTLTHWLIHITARALVKYPKINGEFIDGTMNQHRDANISIAISNNDILVTPVIRSANKKTILNIAEEMRIIVDKVKNNMLSVSDYQNGSFTISNVGMYGVDECISIINPPQVGIMGIGSIKDELAMTSETQVISRKTIAINLSADHRVVNGSYACEFLRYIKKLIECPYILM